MTDSQNETESAVESTQPKFQFQLRHAFYVMTLFAIAMSIDPWILIPAAVWILFCYYSGQPEKRTKRMGRLAMSMPFACCILGPAVLFPISANHHAGAKRSTCRNNIKQLSLAMLNYESGFGEFPEASALDGGGKPMHSWRVRILPFIEQNALYDQYDFSQPWGSPANLKLVDEMPDCFRCPCCKVSNRTPYKLVVGPGTLFDGGNRTIGRIRDGTSNTISIVEDGQNPVEWTRPSDLSVDEAIAALTPKDLKNLPHVNDSTFETIYAPGVVGFFDGSNWNASSFSGSDSTLLRNMLLIDDGNFVDWDQFVKLNSHVVPKYGARVAVGLFLIMMIYPLAWVLRRDDRVAIDSEA